MDTVSLHEMCTHDAMFWVDGTELGNKLKKKQNKNKINSCCNVKDLLYKSALTRSWIAYSSF